jgi:hypothetical protein
LAGSYRTAMRLKPVGLSLEVALSVMPLRPPVSNVHRTMSVAATVASTDEETPLDPWLMEGETIYFDLATLCEQTGLPLDAVRAAAKARQAGSL